MIKMKEQNYDFRWRHWQVHKPGQRDAARQVAADEIIVTNEWRIGYAKGAPALFAKAAADFQDYLFVSMGVSVALTHERGARTLWLEEAPSRPRGFSLAVSAEVVTVSAAACDVLRAVVYLEDVMNLAGAPVLQQGVCERTPLFDQIQIHSASGIDNYCDAELNAIVHAGYDTICIMVKDFDETAAGHCDINDIIERADAFGLKSMIFNYMECYHHPDEPDVQKHFDAVYGELFRRYPKAAGIGLCGESLEFPSRDPHTTGKKYDESTVDGIPDTRPSPGWYPCDDYPAYLERIRDAIHAVKPEATVEWSTYNWGYAPLELRRQFLSRLPKGLQLGVTYEIFSQRELEGLQTPVMDYTISAVEPGYYFNSECAAARKLGIPITANCNVAGIAWDFGTVPYVPVPRRWARRLQRLRQAHDEWGVTRLYATHHYGYWNGVAADLVKWSCWREVEPDYETLLRQVARRDYGAERAEAALAAWRHWEEAMDHYTASNEDQYGPWRVGPAYPFIFQPNLSRTMSGKEIQFPTAPHAHFGWRIIKTFYTPYENDEQSPGFLRYPAEIRSLTKMLELWNKGLDEARKAAELAEPRKKDEARRLEALGHFIRNFIVTTINIKKWWRANMAMQNCSTAEEAEKYLDEIESIARAEMENVRDTIPAVEFDSRLGWEPSMEYVCDKWHLEWKLRQLESALRETAAFRRMLHL